MTENSSTAVGRAAIDAYLDSVEHALLDARAPRSDRVQVLEDLESQIADMLAIGPQPLNEEIVQSVIAKLEPPSHFAATYGNGNSSDPRLAWATQIGRRSSFRWPFVAALSCACLIVGCLLSLLAGGTMFNGGPSIILILIVSMLLVGFLLTPVAVWKAVKQFQRQSDRPGDRELVLKSALVYCVIVPTLLMGLLALATHGLILIPFGLTALVYVQFLLVRGARRRLSEILPPQPAGDATAHTPAPSVGTAMSMPAV